MNSLLLKKRAGCVIEIYHPLIFLKKLESGQKLLQVRRLAVFLLKVKHLFEPIDFFCLQRRNRRSIAIFPVSSS